MNILKKNTISNIVTRIWSLISVYLFIPLYIKILGETAYGLVSFFATIQMVVNILGLGLANTLRREFATGDNNEETKQYKYKLMRCIENIYYTVGIIIVIICFFSASFISNQWLNIENLNPEIVSNVVRLMGTSVVLQMILSIYTGCLMGLEKQLLANSYCLIWSIAKSCGSVLLIWLIKTDLRLFYTWHIICDMVYLLALRYKVKKELRCKNRLTWNISDNRLLIGIWQYAVGVLLISFVALVNKELDKIIISKYLTLTEFGAYNLATTLGSLTTIFATAMYTAVFPRFTGMITTKSDNTIEKEFIQINRISNIITACLGSFIAIYAITIIEVWTHNNNYSQMLTYAAPLVVIAVAFSELQEIPYALALANGNTKINVLIGVISLPFVFAITWYGIEHYGINGAAVVYVIVMVVQTIIYQFFVYKKYVKQGIKLILQDTLLPFTLSMGMAFGSSVIINRITKNKYIIICYAIVIGSVSLLILLKVIAEFSVIEKLKEIVGRKNLGGNHNESK